MNSYIFWFYDVFRKIINYEYKTAIKSPLYSTDITVLNHKILGDQTIFSKKNSFSILL